MKNDTLSEVFDVESVEINTTPAVVGGDVITQNFEKVESDYDLTRDNLHALLQQGKTALQHAIDVAKQSEHPRAFEVVGNLMKQLADINQQLMDVHQQKKKLDEPAKGEASKTVTNNNAIFVGSTAELNKMIQKMNKGD